MVIPTLGYAIMALLARQPGTGYELSARVRRPLGYFWTAQHSQIHPQLKRLLAAGLVSYESAPGPGPRPKKIYSVTESGMRELRDWVVLPPRAEPVRSELLLKAYAVWTADPLAAGALFAKQIAGYEEQLAEYTAIRTRIEGRHGGGAPPADHPEFGNYATVLSGIRHTQQDIEWCQWLVSRLAALDKPPRA